jgi:hypothetical protein
MCKPWATGMSVHPYPHFSKEIDRGMKAMILKKTVSLDENPSPLELVEVATPIPEPYPAFLSFQDTKWLAS